MESPLLQLQLMTKRSTKKQLQDWSKTEEAQKLRKLEQRLDLQLNGIAYFLANNPPVKQ